MMLRKIWARLAVGKYGGNASNQKRFLAEFADADAQLVQCLLVGVQEGGIASIEFERQRQQELLRGSRIGLEFLKHFLEQDTLVRGMLIHQDKTFGRFDEDVELANHAENPPTTLFRSNLKLRLGGSLALPSISWHFDQIGLVRGWWRGRLAPQRQWRRG